LRVAQPHAKETIKLQKRISACELVNERSGSKSSSPPVALTLMTRLRGNEARRVAWREAGAP
jgi:hypothetical protein